MIEPPGRPPPLDTCSRREPPKSALAALGGAVWSSPGPPVVPAAESRMWLPLCSDRQHADLGRPRCRGDRRRPHEHVSRRIVWGCPGARSVQDLGHEPLDGQLPVGGRHAIATGARPLDEVTETRDTAVCGGLGGCGYLLRKPAREKPAPFRPRENDLPDADQGALLIAEGIQHTPAMRFGSGLR